ncbi:MAG: hypothetical protein WBM63_20090, partial [Sedimenticolaceae bacterium]
MPDKLHAILKRNSQITRRQSANKRQMAAKHRGGANGGLLAESRPAMKACIALASTAPAAGVQI